MMIITIEHDRIVRKEVVASTGHGHGIVPRFLAQRSVKVVLAGDMEEGAMQRCAEYGIEPILSIQGAIDEIIDQYINKQLKSVPIPCDGRGERHRGGCAHEHHHRGNC